MNIQSKILLALLDLSAAFESVDHNMLLRWAQLMPGSATVFGWVNYLGM